MNRQARRHPSRYAENPTPLSPGDYLRLHKARSRSDDPAYRKSIWPRPKAAVITLRQHVAPSTAVVEPAAPKRVRKPRAKKAA